jgi:quercetin dioxygenase-like cupin family protein
VRVLDVRVGPGETTLYHVHTDRTISVVIAAARTWEQFQSRPASPPSADLGPGQVLDNSAAPLPYTHRVANVDTVGFHYVVGVLRAPSNIAAPALSSATGLKLERETQGGRVYRVRLAPGEATSVHRHPQPGLTVQVGMGSLRLEGTAAEAARPDPGTGAWWWRAVGTQHAVRNDGTTVVEVVEIDWQ